MLQILDIAISVITNKAKTKGQEKRPTSKKPPSSLNTADGFCQSVQTTFLGDQSSVETWLGISFQSRAPHLTPPCRLAGTV